MNNKLNIAVIFGGKSVEHDVSIVSAQVVIEDLKKNGKYDITPIYITKKGEWVSGEELNKIEPFKDLKLISHKAKNIDLKLDSTGNKAVVQYNKESFFKKQIKKIDVVFPVMHGTYGEDGAISGFCEMLQVPYVGCGILAGALCMNKIATKQIFAVNNIPSVKNLWFTTDEWEVNSENIYAQIEKELKYPIFVKPANLGSSIGISKAIDAKTLKFAFEVAAHYDSKIIVEEGIANLMEVNCAILGNEDPLPSMLEEPISAQDFLNFEEKYISKGGSMSGKSESKLKIPAPLDKEKTKEIQDLAIKVFKVLNCSGIARVDFLIDKDDDYKIYVNEVNPMPGTLHQHLWKASGIEPEDLVEKLIVLAIERFSKKQQYTYTFSSNILDIITTSGGVKSVKNS
ncbi:MAG: D-alanine--D-alanine ligase family protein [bacterium]